MKNIVTTIIFLLLYTGMLYSQAPVCVSEATHAIKNAGLSGSIYSFDVHSQLNTGEMKVEGGIFKFHYNSSALSLPEVLPMGRYVGYSTQAIRSGDTLTVTLTSGGTAVWISHVEDPLFRVRFSITNPSATGQLYWIRKGGFPGIVNHFCGGDDSVLPVQLTQFTGEFDGKKVVLNWSTASEVNNFGFYIEKSSSGIERWFNIGFVGGHGTTVSPHSYSFSYDTRVSSEAYRLRQLDLDGSYQYSDNVLPRNIGISGVTDSAAPIGKTALHQNYPNPFNPETQILFVVDKPGPISLRVYDLMGKEVAVLVNEFRKEGTYTERFKGEGLSSGTYIYTLQTAEGRLVRRMVLVK